MSTSVAPSAITDNITSDETNMAQAQREKDSERSVEHKETVVLDYDDMTAEEKAQDKRLLRKIDLLILPLATLNYFFSSMDRNDIGNAKLAGFQTDNHLTNLDYSTIVAVFYAGYVSAPLFVGIPSFQWHVMMFLLKQLNYKLKKCNLHS